MERDPFDVSLDDKVALCLRAEEALQHADVKVAQAASGRSGEHKLFLSSEGAEIDQELVECGGGIDAIAVADGLVQARSYPSAHVGSSAQAGWEYVESLGLEREAPRVAEEAAALLRADECPPGVTTVVIDAEQMQLQVHESVGHPTELDRVYGTEAAYAGTSFLKPERSRLAPLRLGAHEHHRRRDHARRPRHLRLRRRGRPGRARADRRRGRPARLPHLARDRCADRPRRRRLDARRRLGSGCRSSG